MYNRIHNKSDHKQWYTVIIVWQETCKCYKVCNSLQKLHTDKALENDKALYTQDNDENNNILFLSNV